MCTSLYHSFLFIVCILIQSRLIIYDVHDHHHYHSLALFVSVGNVKMKNTDSLAPCLPPSFLVSFCLCVLQCLGWFLSKVAVLIWVLLFSLWDMLYK